MRRLSVLPSPRSRQRIKVDAFEGDHKEHSEAVTKKARFTTEDTEFTEGKERINCFISFFSLSPAPCSHALRGEHYDFLR